MTAKEDALNDMSLATGGIIREVVNPDKNEPDSWDKDKTILFNVQLLDASNFRHTLDIDPPETPVTAATYARYGYPFFKLYEQPRGVFGQSNLKSVGALDKELGVESAIHQEESHLVFPELKITRRARVRLNTVVKMTELIPVRLKED